MENEKLYLLAEFRVRPEVLEETKAIFARLLPTVLQEPGCEAMYTTTVDDEANRLIFFEIFASEEAHRFHMAQPYTRQLGADLEGKLSEPLKLTRLHAMVNGATAARSGASLRVELNGDARSQS